MKKVFICSALRGNVEENLQKARMYCRSAVEEGYLPLAPHLLFPQFLDDDVEEERQTGIQMGLELLALCNEVWVFGKTSEGMKMEIAYAKKIGVPVSYHI